MNKTAEKRTHWVGFDLGGTKMLAAVFDGDFKRCGSERKKTKGHEGMEAGLARIVAAIEAALAEARIKVEQLAGIGIGCPGPLDLESGVIHEAPNLGWKNVPVRRRLEDHFHCPVVVANDVDAGTYGEYEFGAGRKARCVLGVFPGTGIGGGCVYDGQLIQGSRFTCMEIGHIPLMADGPLDALGSPGSLEGIASRLAIAGSAAQAAFRGQAPYLHEHCGTDLTRIRSGDLAEAIGRGDTLVEKIVDQAAEHLGLGVLTAVHLLAPDIVVLGGGLVEAMPDRFVSAVKRVLKRRALPAFRDWVQVVPARLGNDATALGAAAWARRRLESGSRLARAGGKP